MNIFRAGLIAALIATGAAKAEEPNSIKLSSETTASMNSQYLANGFAFSKQGTLFLTNYTTASLDNTSLSVLGIHSRNMPNHFNGDTQWIEFTGQAELTQDLGFARATIAAYHTVLPPEVFGITGGNGVFAKINVGSNPEASLYAEKGLFNIGGVLLKGGITEKVNIAGVPVTFEGAVGHITDYFVKKKGWHFYTASASAPMVEWGNTSLTGSLKYQHGFGAETVNGVEAKIGFSHKL